MLTFIDITPEMDFPELTGTQKTSQKTGKPPSTYMLKLMETNLYALVDGEFGVKNSPSTPPWRPSTSEENQRSGRWMQSPKTCAQWISPQRTPKWGRQSHAADPVLGRR